MLEIGREYGRNIKTVATWKAYKKEQNIYTKLITYEKKQVLSKKIYDARDDTKVLYSLVTIMTDRPSNNPLPESKNDEDQVENFASFFTEKIDKIGKSLEMLNHGSQKPIQYLKLGNLDRN